MQAALEGIRVLDLTQIMAGPFCTMLLADLGAEVIKIENPRGGDDSRRMAPPYYNGESAAFIAMNRNKYGIAVDIRTPPGKEVLWRLIETADVLMENFRPGTMARLGFEEVHARYPALIYCSISGFGQTGPYRERGGFDLVAQAMSGVLSITGSPEEPAKVGVPIEGGTSINTIAPHASALLDLRSTDAVTLDQVADRVRSIIEQTAGPGLRTEIDILGERPAGMRSQTDPLVQLAAEAITWLGMEPKYEASSTDANIPISLNIPAVCIGITQVERAHTLEEFLSVPPIGNGLAQLTRLCIEASTLIANT